MKIYSHCTGRLFLLTTSLILLSFTPPTFAETLTLNQILGLLNEHNPNLSSANARQEASQAALTTAKNYPNPEIEVGAGTSTGIGQGALSGRNEQLYLSQTLDLPFVREARANVAEAGIMSSEQAKQAVWLTIRAKTQQAFYEILRRQMELQIAEDNEQLLTQIRDKLKLKVEVGEAARYEEVKAETELLNAVKLRTTAAVQVDDAKSALRALFVDALPLSFEVSGELPIPLATLPDLPRLRETVRERQPLLQQAQSNVKKASAQVRLEEQLRYPKPTLKAGFERDPGLEQWQIGISVPLPIWNQRQGQIAEARAVFKERQADESQRVLSVLRELENAYNRYLIANRQVQTFETGLLKQAEKALKIAEAGYRLGERSILDYLDAQRIFRSVRNDYLNARFDRQSARIDLQRLNADDLEG